jgi:hypothetical protein
MPSSIGSGVFHFAAHYRNVGAAALAEPIFFVAPYDCYPIAVSEVHAVKGTDAGAVWIQVEKLTGTQAPGGGTVLLGNNSGNGFDAKGNINTVQNATFKAGASRKLAKGDRLAIKGTGVLTALDGVYVGVTIMRKMA